MRQLKMKKILAVIISAIMLLTLSLPAFAEDGVTEIKTYEDLLKIKDNPAGSYRLPLELTLPEGISTPKEVMVSIRIINKS